MNLFIVKQLKTQFIIKKFYAIIERLFSYLKIFFLFICLWFVFSGNKDTFLVICGLISVITTFGCCMFFRIISPESYMIKLSFFRYAFTLLKDIILSSINVVKIILSEKLDINPGTISINTSNLTDQEKVLFANLITMTPGTFVIAIEGDNFLIHALNKNSLDFKDNKEMATLLKKMRHNGEMKDITNIEEEIKINN